MDDTMEIIHHAGTWARAPITGEADGVWPPRDTDLRQMPEMIRLFHAIQALNAESRPLALQIVSSRSGEGTSTVAAGLARVAAAERGNPVLLVDAAGQTSDRRPMLFDGSEGSGVWASPHDADLHLARLRIQPAILKTFSAAELQRRLQLLHEQYPLTVIDCPPVSESCDALALSRCCDGTILVVCAETSRREVVSAARDAIERMGGRVIGAVFNKRKMYIPSWLYRFI